MNYFFKGTFKIHIKFIANKNVQKYASLCEEIKLQALLYGLVKINLRHCVLYINLYKILFNKFFLQDDWVNQLLCRYIYIFALTLVFYIINMPTLVNGGSSSCIIFNEINSLLLLIIPKFQTHVRNLNLLIL